MHMAILEARKGIRHGHGGPFGAVIVKDGEVIGKGHNEVVKNNDPTCLCILHHILWCNNQYVLMIFHRKLADKYSRPFSTLLKHKLPHEL